MEMCPYCNGCGECFDASKVRYNSECPPMTRCPVCFGSGEVPKEELKNIDCNRSVHDLVKQNEDEAKLARWEAEKDDPVNDR